MTEKLRRGDRVEWNFRGRPVVGKVRKRLVERTEVISTFLVFFYLMALNIKDEDAVALAAEVAALTGETKTRAIKVALEERRTRVAGRKSPRVRAERLKSFLENEAWAQIPEIELDIPLAKDEREAILGYGPSGV